MKTEILETELIGQERSVSRAVDVLKKAGLIVYPTETCYGIGADATNSDAVERVYRIKKRNNRKPISVLVSGMKMAEKYGVMNRYARKMLRQQKTITIVVQRRHDSGLAEKFFGDTIGIRFSKSIYAKKIVSGFGKPITSTSANISGDFSAYNINKIITEFDGKVDLIIDSGNLPERKSSMVYDSINREILRR